MPRWSKKSKEEAGRRRSAFVFCTRRTKRAIKITCVDVCSCLSEQSDNVGFYAADISLNLAARWCTFVPVTIELLSLACRGRTSWQAAYKLGSAQWFLLFPAGLGESNSDTLESVTRRWKQTKPQILPEKLSSAVCPKPSSLVSFFIFIFFLSPWDEKKRKNNLWTHLHASSAVI